MNEMRKTELVLRFLDKCFREMPRQHYRAYKDEFADLLVRLNQYK